MINDHCKCKGCDGDEHFGVDVSPFGTGLCTFCCPQYAEWFDANGVEAAHELDDLRLEGKLTGLEAVAELRRPREIRRFDALNDRRGAIEAVKTRRTR